MRGWDGANFTPAHFIQIVSLEHALRCIGCTHTPWGQCLCPKLPWYECPRKGYTYMPPGITPQHVQCTLTYMAFVVALGLLSSD